MGEFVFALLAAASNAVSVTTRHTASAAGAQRESGWRLAVALFRSPLWLLGWLAQIGAFVFQAIALHVGELSVVQPLLVTELVLALVLRRVWLRKSVAAAEWGGAVMACAGLAVFIAAAEPKGGGPAPAAGHWVVAIIACAAVAIAAAALGQRGSPARRAALLGAAAGVTWAIEATFIKETTDTVAEFGLAGMFVRWPVYALAVGGAAGVILEQFALQAGPLRAAQPMMVIIDPITSIALSVWLFGEYFVLNAAALTTAAVAFCVMCGGVVLLSMGATPPAVPAQAPATTGP
ncbi:MAG TPA: DMT family transporter [Trebonia sp.]